MIDVGQFTMPITICGGSVLGAIQQLLINSPEASLVTDYLHQQLSARNVVILIQQDQVNAEVILGLAGGGVMLAKHCQC